MVADRGQGVGQRADSHPLNIGRVVARSTVVVIQTVLDAVGNQQGEKRHGQVFGIQPLDEIIATDFNFDKMFKLCPEGFP